MEANEVAGISENLGPEESAHILVIRLSAMGDVAMIVPVLSTLEKKYPHLRITVLTRKYFEPMFWSLANVSIYAAEVNEHHKGIIGLWRLFKELKRERPNAVADLHNVLRSRVLSFFFSFTKIPLARIDKGRAEKKALTALKNKNFKPLKTTHDRYVEVFKKLGYSLSSEVNWHQPKRALSTTAQQLVGAHDLKWVGIAPFAAFEGKMYPMSLMKTVLDVLNNTNEYKLLLFGGGQAEAMQLQELEQHLSNAVSIPGRLSFEEELALISNLNLMVSMDSGNGHLAAIFGIPTVTLWGVTHPYAGFYPFGQDPENALLANREQFPMIPTSVYGNKFPKGYDQAITTISPDMVVRKIKEVLSKAN